MTIFARLRPSYRVTASRSRGIDRFWSWWAVEGAERIAAAIADGDPEGIAAELTEHVRAIDPGLAWELGEAGRADSQHVLVVTCEGDPGLRAVARRWRQAAPAAGVVWEFSDSRLPVADLSGLTLEIAGVRIDVASATVSARDVGTEIDVTVFHPGFVRMAEEQRSIAAYILLDQVVGEADVETWIGTVEVAAFPLPESVLLADLRAIVHDLAESYTDDAGNANWILVRSEAPDGTPVMASAQVPLKATSAPHLDTFVSVTVPFSDLTADGLPAGGSLQALRDLEDHLNDRLGGTGHVVAHQTHAGKRVLHIYVDSTTPAVEQLRAAVVGWNQGDVVIGARADPSWGEVAHLRG